MPGGLVESIAQTGGNFAYTYDDNGNIVSVVQDGKTTAYTYDDIGQLIQVDDEQENATWVYEYDMGGNILSKKKFAYGVIDGEPLESKTFTYGNANWKDQLTAVDDVPITYDEIGNPLTDGEWTYTWQNGRQLASMTNGTTTASFVYNEQGLRVQKTVNGIVTNYTLHGKNIVHMTEGTDELHFFYDAKDRPAIVVFNGTPYSYVKNLQGDIVAILDNTGSVVVSYTYDAWGVPTGTTGIMKDTLGKLNPFRYRGYVYDEETGLYYLGSRYYSSAECRFVNADVIVSTINLFSSNLYAYCTANPIVFYDDSGYAMVCCFDDNGLECTFSTMVMGGCCGGGSGAAIGYATVEIVKDMDKEDWINEAKTIAVIALSLASSSVIMSGAHWLGKAFFAQATASTTATVIDFGIGGFLYGETVAGGLFLSYAADGAINHLFDREYTPPEPEDVAIDFTLEWVPFDIPMAADFFLTYVEESFNPIPPAK